MASRLALPVLLLAVGALYLFTAGTAILDDGDALYAHVAQQMVERGDWVTPYANGVRFLDKPPMMYWLMAASYQVFGMNERAARLPSVLAVLGTALLLYWMGARAAGRATAAAAAAALAFCAGTFLFTRMVFPDILFVFFLTLAVAAFLSWYLRPARSAAMLFYAALAGAVLTKGLIGLAFPVAIAVLLLLWSGELARLKEFHPGKGLVLFLALAVPWHALAAARNAGFLWYFFVNEQFLRFLGRRQPVDYESVPLPIFWGLALVWLLPWTAFLPAIRHLLRTAAIEDAAARAVVRLSLAWAAVVVVFFSLSSRIEHYVLPLVPAVALLAAVALVPGRLLASPADERRRRAVARGFAWLAFAGVAAAAAGAVAMRRFAPGGEPAVHALEAYRTYFAPLGEMPQAVLARFRGPLAATLAALAVGTAAAWRIHRRGSTPGAAGALAGMMAVFFLSATHSLAACEDILSSRRFAEAIAPLRQPGDSVIVVGDFETGNSINFYLRAPIEIYDGTAAVLAWGLSYPDAPRRILSRQDLDARWTGAPRTFVVAPEGAVDALALPGGTTLLRSAGRVLLLNRKEIR